MRAIIIGAGRGSRLRHLTEDIPKTLVPVLGRPMLDHVLDALAEGGIARSEVTFVCGYLAHVLRERHPELEFRDNPRWEHNNILASLLCARDRMHDGFVSTYADIVYRAAVVEALVAAPGDLVLACDTDWRRRYVRRSQHPETDAEKLIADGDRVTRISRTIAPEHATGEFIGVMKASPAGAAALISAFDRAQLAYPAGEFREGRSFERAYLIDLIAVMIEAGVDVRMVPTHGGYMEIDTLEDESLAAAWWRGDS